jgi:hypothetical protein
MVNIVRSAGIVESVKSASIVYLVSLVYQVYFVYLVSWRKQISYGGSVTVVSPFLPSSNISSLPDPCVV